MPDKLGKVDVQSPGHSWLEETSPASSIQWVTRLIWKDCREGGSPGGKVEATGEPDKVNVPETEGKRR